VTFFAGLDLAWTPHHESGLCILRLDHSGLELLELSCRIETPQAFASLLTTLGPDTVVAVDAPLVRTSSCQAERELARAFGHYTAPAYTASTDFLERHQLLAGPLLGDALRGSGFELDPLCVSPRVRGRFAFEMYPHAAHVVHFRLDERMKYKKGPLAARRSVFADYQSHLRALAETLSPHLTQSSVLREILAPAAIPGAARPLKQLEDRLDAVICALMAYAAWRDGIERCEVFGSARDGCIAVPGLRFDSRFGALHALRCAHPHQREDAREADLRREHQP
jgi:predicted RNase H-like nuclease